MAHHPARSRKHGGARPVYSETCDGVGLPQSEDDVGDNLPASGPDSCQPHLVSCWDPGQRTLQDESRDRTPGDSHWTADELVPPQVEGDAAPLKGHDRSQPPLLPAAGRLKGHDFGQPPS